MDSGDNGKSFTLMAFLVMAVAMVGLTGLFATFAAPLALERQASREVALDAALATDGKPERLEALRDALGDSAQLVFSTQGNLGERVAAARTAMRVQLAAEAAEAATRLRWLISVITLVAAGFGAMLVGLAGRNK
jgi:hypothetical protein